MIAAANPEQTIGQRSEIALQRQWPQLGRELFTLESALTDTVGAHEKPLTEWERTERRASIREKIIAQLYRDEEEYSLDLRYCALLLVAKGRGGDGVNPFSRTQEEVNFRFNQARVSLPCTLADVKPSCSYLAMRLTSASVHGLCLVGLIASQKTAGFC